MHDWSWESQFGDILCSHGHATTTNQSQLLQAHRIREESTTEATINQHAASIHLHDLYGVPDDEALDVCVTCDGTWSKRGFTALYGVVVVASWESGQVLDCELVSKYCHECATLEKLSKVLDEYQSWWEGHKESCDINHTGSLPAMEAARALRGNGRNRS